jgi:hypothetical protein
LGLHSPVLFQRGYAVPRQVDSSGSVSVYNKTYYVGKRYTSKMGLLLLDTWQRSGLPAADFAALVGISKFSLFAWKKKFEQEGPAGLMDKPTPGSSPKAATRSSSTGKRCRCHSPTCRSSDRSLGKPISK